MTNNAWTTATENVSTSRNISSEQLNATPARVWVLTNGHPGNTTQVVGLAEALGWSYEVKELHFRATGKYIRTVLAFLPGMLQLHRKDAAFVHNAVWPEVVIGVGCSTAPITRWVGRHNPQSRVIQLGRGGGVKAWHYHGVITPVYCCMPPHHRRLEITLPLNPINSQRLTQARQQWPDLFAGLPQPHIVVLVGGDAKRFTFSAVTATKLGTTVRMLADKTGGTIITVTSRRTSDAAIAALKLAIGPQHRFCCWHAGNTQNPYLGYLAGADVLVVTGESESMLAEAAATDKPLYIFPIPERPSRFTVWCAKWICKRGAFSFQGERRRWLDRFCGQLIRWGIVAPRRNLFLLHQKLLNDGRAKLLGDTLDLSPQKPLLETPRVVEWLINILQNPVESFTKASAKFDADIKIR